MKKQKENLIGIIIDTTLSFANVYPQIFFMLKDLITAIKENSEECEVRFGITLLNSEIRRVYFREGNVFSNDIDEVIESLTKVQFYGGSTDGCEDLTQAINFQLEALNSVKNANRGLILISDSMPSDGNNYPDFTGTEPGEYGSYQNFGLRFANIYAYDDAYMPKLRIVDETNELTENGINCCTYESLMNMLDRDEASAKRKMKQTARKICSQFNII